MGKARRGWERSRGNLHRWAQCLLLPVIAASACGGRATKIDSRGATTGGDSGNVDDAGGQPHTGGDSAGATSSSGAVGGATTAGSSGTHAGSAGSTSGAGFGGGGTGPLTGGAGGEDTESGAAGVAAGSGGAPGASGEAGSDAGGQKSNDAYAPRSGPFKVLVYPRTQAWESPGANAAGEEMLAEIATEYGFELSLAEDEADFTPENLEVHELVVFLNTSGDVLDPDGEQAFEEWMVKKNGAFLGTHRAGDTERDWGFYKELLGEYYDGQTICCPELEVEWEAGTAEFPAVKAVPSPWLVGALWLFFDDYREWSMKPGFKILGTVDVGGFSFGRENAIAPVSFVREWSNFRSFYTVFGFRPEQFEDENVKRHVAAGLLWAVRREHWLEAAPPQ